MLSQYRASQPSPVVANPLLLRDRTPLLFLLVASQKTLPVMVAVVEQLHGTLGESGLLVLPCVAAHLNQIIMDSFLINIWLGKGRTSDNAKVA
ncbi:putative sodium/metabolite cotransporter BASS4, chloroplastic [Vitis vinifera]|uniref:Putative sodium/metabolite cotransporter BASS4, chloroplastic n=1 Tax=Vitis vinifera TaxID=29760 RepID=A0A438DNG4_VITVI|nr:putative sodium/metabolite cotransporter BASS4, chloroplastic [Vitis vinifera]